MGQKTDAHHGKDHIFVGADPIVSPWIDVSFQNSWANEGSPFFDVQYRWGVSGLEFRGHMSGGSSGTVAFTLPAAYRPAADVSALTDVVTGAAPATAQIYIESSTGEATITLL